MEKEDNDELVDYDDADDLNEFEGFEFSCFETKIEEIDSLVYLNNNLKLFNEKFQKELSSLMDLLNNKEKEELKNAVDSVENK